jgi:hypothetical protein
LRGHTLELELCRCDDESVGDDRDELADTLAEAGRRLGQALSDALDRIRPALDSVAGVADRPEIRAVLSRAEQALRLRPCLCFCSRAHAADQDICETLGAVILGRHRAGWLGELDVPLCAPCAAARAADKFAR